MSELTGTCQTSLPRCGIEAGACWATETQDSKTENANAQQRRILQVQDGIRTVLIVRPQSPDPRARASGFVPQRQKCWSEGLNPCRMDKALAAPGQRSS